MKRILLLAVGLLVASWASAQLIEVGFEEFYVHPDEDITDSSINGGLPVNYDGYVTYRLYAYLQNPDDEVVSVTGSSDGIFSFGLTEDGQQLFQHPSQPNSSFGPLSDFFLGLPTLPMYQYDSFFTIGYVNTSDSDGASWQTPSPLGNGSDDWEPAFHAGNDFVINTFFGGGFFIVPTTIVGATGPGFAVTDEEGNHKVCLGQFTIDTADGNALEFLGCIDVHVNGLAADPIEDQIATCGAFATTADLLPVLGCTNPEAVNFDELATVDDGTCEFPCEISIDSSLVVVTDIACFGDINGSISATGSVSGNQGAITYSLNNIDFSTSANFNNLTAGAYTLYVLDGGPTEECLTSQEFVINSGSELTAQLEPGTLTTPTCNGLSDGSFCVVISGGVAPYTTALTQAGLADGGTELCFTGLSTGTYTVWVQDANGCIETTNGIFINQPGPVTIQASVENNATCSYSEDGCIIALGSGGTPVITYEIEGVLPPQTETSLCGLAPGTYVVTAAGSNGCSVNSMPITITAPPALEAIAGEITDISCFGLADGEICVSASGGNGTYTYSQDSITFSTVACFPDLLPGSYTFYAQSGACTDAIILEVDTPDEITFLTEQTNVEEDCDGALEVINLSGGTGNIAISWEDTDGNVLTTEEITDLCEGESYTLTLEDDNGCEVVVTESFDIVLGLYELANNISINMYPNPTAGLVNLNIDGLSGQRVSAVIINALGEQVSTQDYGVLNGLWTNELNLGGEADGIYFINLTIGEETITQRVIKH